jgi:hypothetical protein
MLPLPGWMPAKHAGGEVMGVPSLAPGLLDASDYLRLLAAEYEKQGHEGDARVIKILRGLERTFMERALEYDPMAVRAAQRRRIAREGA